MATQETEPLRIKDRRDDFPIFIHSELDDYGLNPVEFRVYSRLARRAGQHGKHSESIPNMAAEFEVSIRTIQYALKVLVVCRLVTRHSRPGKTDEYSLNPRSVWQNKTKLQKARKELKPSGATTEGTKSGATTDSGATREGGVVQPQIGVVVQPESDEGTPSEGTPIKEIRSHKDLLFESVASVCRIDWQLCTTEQRGQINQTVGKLRAAGHTPQEVERVGEWWFRCDWRGQKGQVPKPSQIREVWKQALTPPKRQMVY